MAMRAAALWIGCLACYVGGPPPPTVAPSPSGPPPAGTPTPLAGPATPAVAAPRTPERVQFDLDDARSLALGGWQRNPGGHSTFGGGKLALDSRSYEEWMQRGEFITRAGNGPWAVEARFSMDTPCANGGLGLWIHDGLYFVHVVVTDHELLIGRARTDIGSTGRLRTYRIELADGQVTASVDGKVVQTSPAVESESTVSLSFGHLGDGCASNSSTWDYIAYETRPPTRVTWPLRDEWHAGTTAAQLLDALRTTLPSAIASGGTLDDRDAPCIALVTVDSALRDLLSLAYDVQGSSNAAQEIRSLQPLTEPRAPAAALAMLDNLTEPRRLPGCDPVPGPGRGLCPPPPPPAPPPKPRIGLGVRKALDDVRRWPLHPTWAERSTELAAHAYADAIAMNLPGAEDALKRLRDKLAALARHPAHCGI
jgi:hypothetical protein